MLPPEGFGRAISCCTKTPVDRTRVTGFHAFIAGPSRLPLETNQALDRIYFGQLVANRLSVFRVRFAFPEPFISGAIMIHFVTFNLQASFRTSEDRAALITALLRRA